ncbi:Xaa-Pro dipeptidase [Actinomyces sp. 2119]|uniref:amidohydrolase family protein n=1 Tax=Actinomyces sp. 2119 TaxID=2321393 RepID=UPI000E6C8B4D|nr:amidohydrolase family protein [Actinomyces sp. 2119]RJF43755.1 Xaa-Pro dipeptidase [Actinomyces sp. 2119]
MTTSSTWITPPTAGSERLDGTEAAIVTADRLLTGRRGSTEASLEVLTDPGHRVGVLLDGSRIAAVGALPALQAAAASLPGRTPPRHLDLEGATLMPGLIDTHVHLATSGTDVEYPDYGDLEIQHLTLNAARSARELLSVGVTAVQSLGARHYVDVALRDAIAAGSLRGPQVRAAGPQITTTSGHSWQAGSEVDGLDSIRHAVRYHHKRDVDTVKFMATGGFTTGGSAPWNAQFTTEEMALIVSESHRLGHLCAAHAHGTQGIDRATVAGVDYLAHASFVSTAGRSEFDPGLADRMAEAGIYVDCTVTAELPALVAYDDSFAPPVRLLWEHGVRVVTGHDAGIPAIPHRSYVGGLEALEQMGLPRSEVILAATSRAAAAIGLAGVTGVLAVGYDADLIAVEGDPTQDLAVLRCLKLVATKGREFVADPVPGLARRAERRGQQEGRDSQAAPLWPDEILGAYRDRARRAAAHPQV